MKLKTYTIDAFSETVFSGNPAAVCVLDRWLSEDMMQNIAQENNLSETAFLVKNKTAYEIRWFTPTVEVDLCGHATLASAHVLFEFYEPDVLELVFNTQKSGSLKVFKKDGVLFLDFPTDVLKREDAIETISQGINTKPIEVFRGKTDLIAVLKSEEEVKNLNANFSKIAKLNARGLIVTAQGTTVDFVSRFFAPQSGVDEDPVTGSAHTSLTPLWAEKLKKKALTARQLSKRGGDLYCIDKGERTLIGGNAQLYLEGWIEV